MRVEISSSQRTVSSRRRRSTIAVGRREKVIMDRIGNSKTRTANVGSRHSSFSTIHGRSRRENAMKRGATDLCDQHLQKIMALLREGPRPAAQTVGDEPDRVRGYDDFELRASLRVFSQSRLASIASTLARLNEAWFGTCQWSGGQICPPHLQSLLFGRCCLDCRCRHMT